MNTIDILIPCVGGLLAILLGLLIKLKGAGDQPSSALRKIRAAGAMLLCVAGLYYLHGWAFPPPDHGLVGAWKSPNQGVDFPIWMVDTYSADGTLRTDLYSKPADTEIRHPANTRYAHWRIRDHAVEIGFVDSDGAFQRLGPPRPFQTDASGKIRTIQGWTPNSPTSTPAPAAGN